MLLDVKIKEYWVEKACSFHEEEKSAYRILV
jgi:hypothetical protein